jgi:PAS domain S-box-containing protein
MEHESNLQKIKTLLKAYPKGLTIEEVSLKLILNRATAAKYLNSLVLSGQADLRELGRAKLFCLTRRVPLMQVMDLLSDLILILDKDLTITDVNDAFLNWFDIPKEKLISVNLKYSLLNGFFSDDFFTILSQALEGPGSTCELMLTRYEESRYFRIRFIPLVFEEGARGAGIIFENITEMKRHQHELEDRILKQTQLLAEMNAELERKTGEYEQTFATLRENEEKYRCIVETANEGIWITDAAFVITFANRKISEMLGYAKGEILGMKSSDFIFPDDFEDHRKKTGGRKNSLPDTYERRLRCRDGGECWTIMSAMPIRDKHDRFSGSFVMVTDISLQKQLETELERMQRK